METTSLVLTIFQTWKEQITNHLTSHNSIDNNRHETRASTPMINDRRSTHRHYNLSGTPLFLIGKTLAYKGYKYSSTIVLFQVPSIVALFLASYTVASVDPRRGAPTKFPVLYLYLYLCFCTCAFVLVMTSKNHGVNSIWRLAAMLLAGLVFFHSFLFISFLESKHLIPPIIDDDESL